MFRGLGYTMDGYGRKIERIYREIKPVSVGGGSEEIMLDLSMRNASKLMPNLWSYWIILFNYFYIYKFLRKNNLFYIIL